MKLGSQSEKRPIYRRGKFVVSSYHRTVEITFLDVHRAIFLDLHGVESSNNPKTEIYYSLLMS